MKSHFLFFLLIVLTLPSAAQWSKMAAPSGSGINYSLLMSHDSVFLAGSNGLGIYRSTDNGLNWSKINDATLEASTNAITLIDNVVYIGTNSTGVHASANFGSSWSARSTGMTNKKIHFINAVGPYLLAAGPTLYRSTDKGLQWTAAGTGLPGTDIKGMVIVNGTIIISAKDNGIYASTDSGATFSAFNGNLPHKYTGCLVLKGTKLFLTLGSTVMVSTDNGTVWTEAGTGLPTSIANIFCLYTDGSRLFLGTFGSGCYYSANDGASWSAANAGFTVLNVRGFAVRGADVFCSADNGIWKQSLSGFTTGVRSTGEYPDEFRVDQNFPNPFNPTTTITYRLPERGRVVLKVYTVLGQEVATPVNGLQEAGEQRLSFDASLLPSGVYYYTVRTSSYSAVKKMTVMK